MSNTCAYCTASQCFLASVFEGFFSLIYCLKLHIHHRMLVDLALHSLNMLLLLHRALESFLSKDICTLLSHEKELLLKQINFKINKRNIFRIFLFLNQNLLLQQYFCDQERFTSQAPLSPQSGSLLYGVIEEALEVLLLCLD